MGKMGRMGRMCIMGVIAIVAVAIVSSGDRGLGQQIHRQRFETENTVWKAGRADAKYTVKSHARVQEGARSGRRCEYIRLEADRGSFIHFYYPTPKAPLSEELTVGVYIKANQPNIQLLARLVLPHERDPKSLDDRMTALIRGDRYTLVSRWQKLEIRNPLRAAQQQQQLMQAQLKRPVNFKDAYIDRIILNVYGGPGRNDVWIDDLQVGPVTEDAPLVATGPKGKRQAAPTRRAASVEFSAGQLLVNGKRFFIRGIRHSGTPIEVLHRAGFNTLWLSPHPRVELARKASELGLWLVPSLPVARRNSFLVSRGALGKEVANFPAPESVLFWDLGGSLVFEQSTLVDRSARVVKSIDAGRPVGADVWDGMMPYSQSLDLIGTHRWPLMTSLELPQYRTWLTQRRRLAGPNTFIWTWVQNHTPDFLTRLLYDQTADKEFDRPVGPQPAQIRLLTYTALGSGCRGVAFWSDRFLADSHGGRDRLLESALLNMEMEMLEPFLLTTDGTPQWIETSEKNVKAAVFRTAKGVLVLVMWHGPGAQFVPGQSAATNVKIVVPMVPPGNQAWEVTPGEVRSLRTKRVVGGTQVRLPEFGLTTAIVFTSDIQLIDRLQKQCRADRRLAAQWTFKQAREEILKVVAVQKELAQLGEAVPQESRLIADAQRRLTEAKAYWDNRLFGDAFREAQRSLRPIRVLMRAQWEKATAALDSPVAVPYAVSYYTLPQFWRLVHRIRRTTPAANVLPGGDFEVSPTQRQNDWVPQKAKLDNVDLRVERVGKGIAYAPGKTIEPKKGRLCAMLQIHPAKDAQPIEALERTYLSLVSRSVRLKPGTPVRISAWVRIPQPIRASVDGVLLFDSIGGEPLAYRTTEATTGWRRISLYRVVPASGQVQVTLALSGLGTVFFDDVRIEPLQESR